MATLSIDGIMLGGQLVTTQSLPVNIRLGINHTRSPPGRLMRAARRGDIPSLIDALKDGCSTEEAHVRGPTALIEASQYSQLPVILALLNAGADVNATYETRDGRRNALYAAASRGNSSAVKLLLGDPRLEYPGCGGPTPLHIAARGGHIATMRALLADSRVDCSALDSEGLSPLEIARRCLPAKAHGRKEILSILQRLGASGLGDDDASYFPTTGSMCVVS